MATEEGTLSVIFDKVSFVTHVPLLLKATSDDEIPTPGYAYQEICNLSLASGSYCLTLLDYLVDRLQKDSYHVKLKVLRILHYIIQNGHPDFRQGLRRRAFGVQAATKYSGPPDPLHGNTPYMMVRKAAQDLSQLLFDVNTDDGKVPEVSSTSVKTQGGMGNSFIAPGKMQGFGNTTNIPNKSFGETIMSGIKDFAAQVVDPEDPRWSAARATADHFHRGNYSPVKLETTPGAEAASRETVPDWERSTVGVKRVEHRQMRQPHKVKAHRPGVAGGGWEDDPQALDQAQTRTSTPGSASSSSSHRGVSEVSHSSTSADPDNTSSELGIGMENVNVEDWSTEEEIVNNVIQQPINLMLSRNDVNNFLKRCAEVNAEQVIIYLNEYLKKEEEPQTFRSLLLLDFLMKGDLVTVDHITAICAASLVSIYKNCVGPSKSKARKVIRQLQALTSHSGPFIDMPGPEHSPDTSAVEPPKRENLTQEQQTAKPRSESGKLSLPLDLNSLPDTGPVHIKDLTDCLVPDSSPEWSSLKIPFAKLDKSENSPNDDT